MQIRNTISLNDKAIYSSMNNLEQLKPIDSIFSDIYKNSFIESSSSPTVKVVLGSLNDGLRIESISTTYSYAPGVSCESALSKLQSILNTNNTYQNDSVSQISPNTKYEITVKPITNDENNLNSSTNSSSNNSDLPIDTELNMSKIDLSPSKVNYSSGKGDVFDKTKAKPSKDQIYEWIDKYSTKYNMDSSLVKAIIRAESNFNNQCISSAGAVGLMQLMPETAKEMGLIVNDKIDERWNPEKNIEAGIKYITKYHKIISKHFGKEDWNLTLAGYNAGPNRVIRQGGIPNIKETRDYVSKINRYWNEYK